MKEDKKKKTAGQQIYENTLKPAYKEEVSVIELGEEMLGKNGEKYLDQVNEAVMRGIRMYPAVDEFYVEVLTKYEKALSDGDSNTINQKFSIRLSCPSPACDQTVFRYDTKSRNLLYLWSIPDKDSCHVIYRDRNHLAPEYELIIQHVIDFFDGTLLEKAKKLCKEDILQTGLITPVTYN